MCESAEGGSRGTGKKIRHLAAGKVKKKKERKKKLRRSTKGKGERVPTVGLMHQQLCFHIPCVTNALHYWEKFYR